MSRPLPPPLELVDPLCTLCGEYVTHDGDEFGCGTCHASWPDTSIGSARGEWETPDAERCTALDGRFYRGGCFYSGREPDEQWQCMYVAGHEGAHNWGDGYARHCWYDEDSASPKQIARRRWSR